VLAYEILEICRKICEKQLEKEPGVAYWVTKKADVMLALCECAVVDNRPDQAQNDISEGIELLKGVTGISARRLAEAHMYSARAFLAADEFGKAGKQYRQAHEILSAHRDGLGTGDDDESVKKELHEITTVLSDISERIEDAERSEEQYIKMKEELNTKVVIPTSNTTEINDITSMIRKGTKRPAENTEIEAAKKPKTDENEEPISEDAAIAESV